MLIIALVLAVIGLAALVAAVVTSNELIAWVCIGASVIGVLLLIADALRARRDGGDADIEDGAEPGQDNPDGPDTHVLDNHELHDQQGVQDYPEEPVMIESEPDVDGTDEVAGVTDADDPRPTVDEDGAEGGAVEISPDPEETAKR